MTWTDRRNRFRALLAGNRCVAPISVFDPISARIAEELGFEVGILAGSVASMTVLGAPDLVLLTLSELTEQAHRVCRASDLPLLIDADHGYGNALNVARTVEELETVGVSALTIEDTNLPTPFDAGEVAQLISIEEAVRKMQSAIEARRDKGLAIIGRTTAAGREFDDVIRRVRAYEGTGVDAIFVVGIETKAQLEALSADQRLPLVLANVGGEIANGGDLTRYGVRLWLRGHAPIAAAVQATYETMKAIRSGMSSDESPRPASPELLKRVTKGEYYQRAIQTLLSTPRKN